MTPLEACLLLQSIPGMGAYCAVRLISHFGSAEAVFAASSREWIEVEGIGEQLCIALAQWKTYRSNVQASLETLSVMRFNP